MGRDGPDHFMPKDSHQRIYFCNLSFLRCMALHIFSCKRLGPIFICGPSRDPAPEGSGVYRSRDPSGIVAFPTVPRVDSIVYVHEILGNSARRGLTALPIVSDLNVIGHPGSQHTCEHCSSTSPGPIVEPHPILPQVPVSPAAYRPKHEGSSLRSLS
jgi:hypothetical protein